jgi:hypothetical protein
MSLTQFKDPRIHFYKYVDHQNKINILSRQVNKFDIPYS